MPSQISLANVYEYLGKGGATTGSTISLGNSTIGCPPTVDPNNLDSTYNLIGNSWSYSPIGGYAISMGDISDYVSLGGFANNTTGTGLMRFKFSPVANLNRELYGDATSYPNTFPYNLGQDGVKMNNTNVSGGSLTGTYSYGLSGYTTWTSVAAGESYKIPTNGNIGVLCLWFKPSTPAANRNWIWLDMDGVNDFNPYRGFWLEYKTDGTIAFSRGDGTGAASSDRYTFRTNFGTSFDGSGNYWQFLALQFDASSNTVGVNNNYAYGYIYRSRTNDWAWYSGATYDSGTGGNVDWSADSGTENTNCMIFNPSGSVGTGLVFQLGHFYRFGENMSFTQIQYVKDITDGGFYTN